MSSGESEVKVYLLSLFTDVSPRGCGEPYICFNNFILV